MIKSVQEVKTFQPVTRADFIARVAANREPVDKIADDCGFIFDNEWTKLLGGQEEQAINLPVDELYFRGVLHRAGVTLWEANKVIDALRLIGVVS